MVEHVFFFFYGLRVELHAVKPAIVTEQCGTIGKIVGQRVMIGNGSGTI